MKITVDIDCTPEEARAFLGLPNIAPMQDELLAQLQQQLSKYLASTDPEAMLQQWLPESIKGLGQVQEQFWRQFMTGMAGATTSSDDAKGKKG
ncbi:MAG: DUF6489 family protein [Pseudomonadota bacterium]